MYHSIDIPTEDQMTHLFLWRNLETYRPPDTYAITALNMGDKPSATIAQDILKKTAEMAPEDQAEAIDSERINDEEKDDSEIEQEEDFEDEDEDSEDESDEENEEEPDEEKQKKETKVSVMLNQIRP